MAYNFEKLEALLKEKGVSKGEIEEIITPLKNMARQRRYGLVWEEPGETSYDKDQADKALEKAFAFLKEVPEKRIEKAPEKPMNLLIEGDNYHTLKALQYTHKGLVDVIYIDPPYNTGNNDFVYNDRFVDKEDGWRHSSWLSFMNKRLKLARELMSDDGVIFISIDDNEMAQLKLLCDQVFGEQNFIEIFSWVRTSTPSNLAKKSRKVTEYVLCYERNRSGIKYFSEPIDGGDVPLLNNTNAVKTLTFPKNSIKFLFNVPGGKLQQGVNGRVELENDIFIVKGKNANEVQLTGKFKWTQGTLDSELRDGTEILVKSIVFSPRFQRIESDKYKTPKNLINIENGVGTNEEGKKDLGNIVENSRFDYPKPVSLIKYLINFTNKKDAFILDFFAGSGTTGHAVMELNKEDGGNRQFILCTNNENNIAEEVTYKRNKRVIEGYTTPKGKVVEGIPNNLSYYKVDLMEDSGDSDQNRLQAIQNAVDLIAIKEQTYQREDKNSLSVLRKEGKVAYVVTDFFSLLDEDMDEIVSSLMQEPETEKVLYTNYAEYAQEQIRYRGEDMPEELLRVLR